MLRLGAIGIGYLIGCLNFAYIIGRYKQHIDIREFGSGNSGTTNAIRVMGLKLGTITFLGDFLKAVAAYYLANWWFGDSIYGLYAGFGVIIGHNWPVFLKFKGGKGIAASIGLIYSVSPLAGLIISVIGIIIVAITKYVSVASMMVALSMPIVFYIRFGGWEAVGIGLVLAIMAIYRHRSNIKRLLNGSENKFGKKTDS